MGRKKGRKGKATLERPVERVQDYRVGASANLDDLGLDDEDAFHLQREKISFDDNFGRRHDDDDEDEEVLGLDMSDSDDHEDDDDEEAEFDQSISDIDENDEDDQDVALLKKLKFNIKAPLDSDDDEEGKGKTKKDDFDDRAWGKSRGIYYDADEASEEEDAKAEEEEARRLQKLQASQLREEDFMDDLDDTFGARLADKMGAYGTAGMDEDTLHGDDNEFDHLALSSTNSLPVHLLSAPASEIHIVQRATTNLSVEERRKIADATIPEIVQLVELFSARWQELKGLLGPTLNWQCIPDPDSSALPSTPKQYARHYLELKYRLITMYLTNVAFYLSLRANPPPGANVKAHPVVETLVNIQELLDQLETRVEGNVASDDGSDSDDVVESDEDESVKRRRRKRKRKIKRQMKKGFPVLLEWVNKWNSGDISESNDEESIIDDMDEQAVPVQVDQEAVAVRERKKSRKDKVTKSSDAAPKAQKKKEEISIDIPDYTPLKSKLRNKKSARQTNGISADFGESRDIDDVDLEDKLAKKRSLQFHVTRVDQAIHARQARKLKSGAGDDDIPYRDANGKLIQPGIARVDEPKQPIDVGTVQDFFKRDVKRDNADLSEHDDDDDGLDYNAIADAAAAEAEAEKKASKKRSRSDSDADSDEEDPEEYYARIVQSKQAAASEREEMHESLRQARTEEVLSTRALLSTDNDLNENSKRLASYKILANKGLTPHRSKEQRNPRVKRRKRYEKATKRLGSFKRVVKDRRTVNVDGYAGEKTGIKKNLSRSVRFAGRISPQLSSLARPTQRHRALRFLRDSLNWIAQMARKGKKKSEGPTGSVEASPLEVTPSAAEAVKPKKDTLKKQNDMSGSSDILRKVEIASVDVPKSVAPTVEPVDTTQKKSKLKKNKVDAAVKPVSDASPVRNQTETGLDEKVKDKASLRKSRNKQGVSDQSNKTADAMEVDEENAASLVNVADEPQSPAKRRQKRGARKYRVAPVTESSAPTKPAVKAIPGSSSSTTVPTAKTIAAEPVTQSIITESPFIIHPLTPSHTIFSYPISSTRLLTLHSNALTIRNTRTNLAIVTIRAESGEKYKDCYVDEKREWVFVATTFGIRAFNFEGVEMRKWHLGAVEKVLVREVKNTSYFYFVQKVAPKLRHSNPDNKHKPRHVLYTYPLNVPPSKQIVPRHVYSAGSTPFLSQTVLPNGSVLLAAATPRRGVELFLDNQSNGRIEIPEDVTAVALSHAGDWCAVGDTKGQITLVHLSEEKDHTGATKLNTQTRTILHWHPTAVKALYTSPDSTHLYSAGQEAVLVSWHVGSLQKTFVPRLGGAISYLSGSSDGSVCVGTESNVAWVVRANKVVGCYRGVRPAPTVTANATPQLVYHKLAQTVMIPSFPLVQQLSMTSGAVVGELELTPPVPPGTGSANNGRITQIALGGNDKVMATVSVRTGEIDGDVATLGVWEYNALHNPATVDEGNGESPSTGWKLALQTLATPETCIAIAPTGKSVVTVGRDYIKIFSSISNANEGDIWAATLALPTSHLFPLLSAITDIHWSVAFLSDASAILVSIGAKLFILSSDGTVVGQLPLMAGGDVLGIKCLGRYVSVLRNEVVRRRAKYDLDVEKETKPSDRTVLEIWDLVTLSMKFGIRLPSASQLSTFENSFAVTTKGVVVLVNPEIVQPVIVPVENDVESVKGAIEVESGLAIVGDNGGVGVLSRLTTSRRASIETSNVTEKKGMASLYTAATLDTEQQETEDDTKTDGVLGQDKNIAVWDSTPAHILPAPSLLFEAFFETMLVARKNDDAHVGTETELVEEVEDEMDVDAVHATVKDDEDVNEEWDVTAFAMNVFKDLVV
ncbi:hypothetical protein HDU85_000624 [Gaertneriomyces sp. JEL0708]|nr:hypothetical protein HDU85_000624 [Gaertneriomyces sp. JEL0708]